MTPAVTRAAAYAELRPSLGAPNNYSGQYPCGCRFVCKAGQYSHYVHPDCPFDSNKTGFPGYRYYPWSMLPPEAQDESAFEPPPASGSSAGPAAQGELGL